MKKIEKTDLVKTSGAGNDDRGGRGTLGGIGRTDVRGGRGTLGGIGRTDVRGGRGTLGGIG